MRTKITVGLILFLIFLFCFSSGVSLAQDPGDADTLRLANISGEIAHFDSMPVFLYNDEELVSVVVPLLVDGYSGWLRFDSVSYAGSRLADPSVLDEREVYVFGTDTFTVDSLLLSFSVSSGDNLPVGTGKLCELWFTLHFGGQVVVDSLSDSPQGGLLLTDTGKGSFVPQFLPGLFDISCDYLIGDVGQDGSVNSADIIMLQKLWFYHRPLSAWPVADRYGAADLKCDRRVDFRDLTYLVDVIFDGLTPCSCGTINPSLYDDPGLPDTVWMESDTLIVGISSPVCISVTNDESLKGMAFALEWDGEAVLELEWASWSCGTDRLDTLFWFHDCGDRRVDGTNPDTFQFYAYMPYTQDYPLPPGRDAVGCFSFIPRSPGTGAFRLVDWAGPGQSMLVTEDHAAILPAFYGGNITVIPYLTGDPNHDGIVDVGDVVYLINYLFVNGPEPDPLESGDADGDGHVNIGDVVYLINYLFIGGPPPNSPPIGILLNYEGCKEFQKGTAQDSVPPDQDCIEYQYDGESVLQLKHTNAGFNCCPEIAADITIENNVITIEEIEISGDCDCLCLFDVDYEISNLPPGEYTIIVTEPYVPEGEEILEFTVDLASSPSGTSCIHRDFYPWGDLVVGS